uniref:Glucose-6-phosphate isomerase n=1 Tax=Ganoderma boninense TaxID=34458 RepID=A0A5K1K2U1_9APHY|nr:Trehalose-6-phosphate phosphatase (EC [Ganoderma boninense]
MDFIAPKTTPSLWTSLPPQRHATRSRTRSHPHRILISIFFVHTQVLAFGMTEEVRKELGPTASDPLAKFKIFEGNWPSNSIIFPLLMPGTLGALIVLYEHKIFIWGVLWGINSFGMCSS